MLHLLGQPIQKKHCQDWTALLRAHRTNWCRLLCTRAFVDISSLYVFYSAFYHKKRVLNAILEYNTAVCFESDSSAFVILGTAALLRRCSLMSSRRRTYTNFYILNTYGFGDKSRFLIHCAAFCFAGPI